MSIPSDNPILLARDLGPGEGAPVYSLAVGDGEIVALTGTALDVEGSLPLLRRLAGADTPAEGELWLKGEPLHTLRTAARLRFSAGQCVVLPRVLKLLPELSVVENTALPLLLTGLGRGEARRRALCWLERLGVAECADWRIGDLTPGELRRVAIARALATEPAVLLAEDPTDGMAKAERLHLLRILRVAAGTHRLTLVLTTADEDVARWADRQVPLPVTPVAEPEAVGADAPAAIAGEAAGATHAALGMRHRLYPLGRHRAVAGTSARAHAPDSHAEAGVR